MHMLQGIKADWVLDLRGSQIDKLMGSARWDESNGASRERTERVDNPDASTRSEILGDSIEHQGGFADTSLSNEVEMPSPMLVLEHHRHTVMVAERNGAMFDIVGQVEPRERAASA